MKRQTIIFLTLAVISFFAGFAAANLMSKEETEKFKQEKDLNEIEERVLNFINSNLLKPGLKAEIVNVSEESGFYVFNLRIFTNGMLIGNDSVYVTKDGKYLFLGRFNLTEGEKRFETAEVNIEDEPWKGEEDAKIVIVEFSGYDCPFCAKFALEVMPKILRNFSVKIVFKDFPVHEEIKAHEAANCAKEQGKYWEYHDILFSRQAEWRKNESKFIDYAEELGLNVTEFEVCLNSGKYREEVLEDKEEGLKLGVRGTPTFFINGKKVVGAIPYEEFEKILKEISGE